MGDLEETIRNIDIFCKVLADKIVEDIEVTNIIVEPMEKLLYKKCVIDAKAEPNNPPGNLIPLPQLEEPLIDVFHDDNNVKILMQCRCKDQKVTIHPSTDGIKICKKECYTNTKGQEICTDKCQKLTLPTDNLKTENIIAKCSNNTVFEVEIPKK